METKLQNQSRGGGLSHELFQVQHSKEYFISRKDVVTGLVIQIKNTYMYIIDIT